MNINFKVIGLTRLGIKPESTAPEVDALTTRPSELYFLISTVSKKNLTVLMKKKKIFRAKTTKNEVVYCFAVQFYDAMLQQLSTSKKSSTFFLPKDAKAGVSIQSVNDDQACSSKMISTSTSKQNRGSKRKLKPAKEISRKSTKLEVGTKVTEMRMRVLQHEIDCRAKEHEAKMRIFNLKFELLEKKAA